MITTNNLGLIRHPRVFLNYLQRERRLKNFLKLQMSEVKAYIKEADQITRTMSQLTKNAELGAMFSPLRGPIVYACIRAMKPNIMVETGVASGSSTRYILSAMELNQKGMLYSIDLPNADPGALIPAHKKTGWLVPSKLQYRWKLILGRSQEKLTPLLSKLEKIDAFLHDGEHTYETMLFEYATTYPHLKEGGLMLSDDVHANNAFYEFCRNTNLTRWITFDGLGAMIK